MRSRARFTRRSRRSRTSRDATPSGRYVPLARFRREVVALLVADHPSRSFDAEKALHLVLKWDRMVRLRHSQGKPPCNVVDHILRYEKDEVVCPCGAPASPLASRDKERARCRSCKRRAARRDPPSRWQRLKAYRDRRIQTGREDFAGMTHNVGEVTKAVASGRLPRFEDLRPVKNPISRLVEGDPDSEQELAHQLQKALKAVKDAEEKGASEATCNRKWKAVFALQDRLKAYRGRR